MTDLSALRAKVQSARARSVAVRAAYETAMDVCNARYSAARYAKVTRMEKACATAMDIYLNAADALDRAEAEHKATYPR